MPEAPRRPTLSVLTGPKAGTKFVVEDAVDNILVGSDPSCRFCLDSPGVSPIHARVWIDLGGATVYDTNSPRGIYVNDDRVVREAPLRSGDVLWLGPPGEDDSVLIQYVAPAAAVEAVPQPEDEPATMILKSPLARPPAPADEQVAIKTEEVEIDEVEMMRIAAAAAVRSAPTVEASAPEEPPPVAADPASFDPASFDPASFEPASFEPASFEPASFEPADEASTGDPSKFEVDLADNTTVRADFEEDIEMTISDVPSKALLGDEPEEPAETVSLKASAVEEPATIFQIAYEPLPTPQSEEPATVFQVPSAPPPSEPPAPVAPAAQSFEDEAVEEAATIVQARPSFDPDAPAVFAATAPPFRPAAPAPAPAPATPPPAAQTRPPSRPAYLPPTTPTPTPRPPRPQPPPTVERARPAEAPRPIAREEGETRTRPRPSGSSKAPMIIAAGVVLLALALGAGWFLMRGRGDEGAPVAEAPSAAPTDVAAGAPPTAEPVPPAGTDAATAAPPDTAPAASVPSPAAVATLPPTLPPVKETVTVVRPSPQVAAGQRPPTSAPPAGTAAKGPAAAATPPPVVAPVEPPPAARAANLVQQAQQAAGSKNYDAAVTLYDEAIKLDPANAAAQSGRTAAVAARAVARRAFVPGRTVVRAGKAGGGIEGFDSSDVSVQKAPDFQGRIELEMSPAGYNAGEPYRLQVALLNEGKKPIKVSGLTVTITVNGTRSATPLTPRVKEIAPQQRAVLEEMPGVWPPGLTSWSAEVLVTAGKDESLRNTLNWR